MVSTASTPDQYIEELPEERKEAIIQLRNTLKEHLLPLGFEEMMTYGSLGYVVPKSTYPAGYHCDTKLPLPFVSIASQKNFVALYHMGLYSDPMLMEWFLNEYPKHCKAKLDMGKSCIRFKKLDQIPYELIGQLMGKMSVDTWISTYESLYRRK